MFFRIQVKPYKQSMNSITLGDLLEIKEIANFTPQQPILRLPNSNFFQLKGHTYELRLFGFNLVKPVTGINTFADYVTVNKLKNVELKLYTQIITFHPMAYSVNNDPNVYLNISILSYSEQKK